MRPLGYAASSNDRIFLQDGRHPCRATLGPGEKSDAGMSCVHMIRPSEPSKSHIDRSHFTQVRSQTKANSTKFGKLLVG